jgi:hypothetical protein
MLDGNGASLGRRLIYLSYVQKTPTVNKTQLLMPMKFLTFS